MKRLIVCSIILPTISCCCRCCGRRCKARQEKARGKDSFRHLKHTGRKKCCLSFVYFTLFLSFFFEHLSALLLDVKRGRQITNKITIIISQTLNPILCSVERNWFFPPCLKCYQAARHCGAFTSFSPFFFFWFTSNETFTTKHWALLRTVRDTGATAREQNRDQCYWFSK